MRNAALWKGHAPHSATGSASASESHCHPSNCNGEIIDFAKRFGRLPQGMWLPETAVDVASLEALAAEGIEFTILEPRQATR